MNLFSFDFSNPEFKAHGRSLISEALNLPVPSQNAQPETLVSDFNEYLTGLPKVSRDGLFSLKPDGIGPGELACYFLFDNILVGGRNSPIDLYLDGAPFAEVKAGKVLKSSPNTCRDFKVTTDQDPAVRTLLNDLDQFNMTYREIIGSDLPEWRGADEIKINSLIDYSKLNLATLAEANPATGTLNLQIDRAEYLAGLAPRTLKYNGKVLNLTGSTTIDEILNLTKKVVVNTELATIEAIVKNWSIAACSGYLNKTIILMDSTNKRMKYLGKVTPNMLNLQYTHRQQPWAIITVPEESREVYHG